MTTIEINLASGYKFRGGNALILTEARKLYGWPVPEWATATQAGRVGLSILPGMAAQGVRVQLNEHIFTVFNRAQLASSPASGEPTIRPAQSAAANVVKFPTPAKASTGAAFAQFKAQVCPDGSARGWGPQARAFYDGIEGTARYTVNTGLVAGDFVLAAVRYLATNGDSQGNAYQLTETQVGWAFRRAVTRSHHCKTNPGAFSHWESAGWRDLDGSCPHPSMTLQECIDAGLAHPRLELTITRQAARKVA